MWKRLLGDLLSPPCCAACDARTTSLSAFCAACVPTIERADRGSEPLAVALFGGAMAVAIRRLKYENRPDLANPLGELLRARCRDEQVAADVVVPVPLHPRRLVERGYNQAALLSHAVARETGARFEPRVLVRIVDTPRQAALGREERLRNIAQAFALRGPKRIAGRRVLLVDDVSTTGATLAACRQALESARPKSVRAIVLARTPTE